MYLTAILPPILLLIATIHALTTDQIAALSTSLAGDIEALDVTVEELTAQSPPATASGLPVDFQNVNLAINAAISNAQSSATTLSPEVNAEFNVLESYSEFANQAENMMYDFIAREALLANTFGVHRDIYNQLVIFNFTFFDWTDFMLTVYADANFQAQINEHLVDNTGRLAETGVAILDATNAYD